MDIVPLDRSFRRHTQGPQKGMITVDHWQPHDPNVRYTTCFSSAAWNAMREAVRQNFEFRMVVNAAEALTKIKTTNGGQQ